jgi:hypothetical protein
VHNAESSGIFEKLSHHEDSLKVRIAGMKTLIEFLEGKITLDEAVLCTLEARKRLPQRLQAKEDRFFRDKYQRGVLSAFLGTQSEELDQLSRMMEIYQRELSKTEMRYDERRTSRRFWCEATPAACAELYAPHGVCLLQRQSFTVGEGLDRLSVHVDTVDLHNAWRRLGPDWATSPMIPEPTLLDGISPRSSWG